MRISDWSSSVLFRSVRASPRSARRARGAAGAGRRTGGGWAWRGQHSPLPPQGYRARPAGVSDPVSLESAAQNTDIGRTAGMRSEEHTSELQSLMRNSYAVFCLKKKKNKIPKYS